MRQEILFILCVVTIIAGCIDPVPTIHPPVPNPTAVPAAVLRSVPSVPGLLLYVSAHRVYGASGVTDEIARYAETTDSATTVLETTVYRDGTHSSVSTHTFSDPTLYLPALPPVYLPGASGFSGILDDVTTSAPASGTAVSYWLTSLVGAPTWVVDYVTAAGVHSREVVDPGTLAVTHVDPAAAIPSAPRLNVLDFSSTAALEIANATAHSWAADAHVIGIQAKEQNMTSFANIAWGVDHVGGVLVPPDLAVGDGNATAWLVTYESASQDLVLPVSVLASAVATQGDPLTPVMPPARYHDLTDSGPLISSVAAAIHVPVAHRRASWYVIDNEGGPDSGSTWVLLVSAGNHLVKVWAKIDAHSNDVIDCVFPCT